MPPAQAIRYKSSLRNHASLLTLWALHCYPYRGLVDNCVDKQI
jgi:hypothetical protein